MAAEDKRIIISPGDDGLEEIVVDLLGGQPLGGQQVWEQQRGGQRVVDRRTVISTPGGATITKGEMIMEVKPDPGAAFEHSETIMEGVNIYNRLAAEQENFSLPEMVTPQEEAETGRYGVVDEEADRRGYAESPPNLEGVRQQEYPSYGNRPVRQAGIVAELPAPLLDARTRQVLRTARNVGVGIGAGVGFLTVSALVGHGIVEGVRAVGHAVGGGLNVGPLTADNVVGLGIRTAGDTVGAYLDTIGRAVNLAKNLAGGNSPYPGTAEDALKTAIGAAYTAVDVAKRGPLRRGGELLLGVARKRG